MTLKTRVRPLLICMWYWFTAFGYNPRTFLFGLQGLPTYWRHYFLLRNQMKRSGSNWKIYLNRPCLHDRFVSTGPPGGHYFHQDLLVASRIYRQAPEKHVDVGSSIAGFVSHLAVFRTVEVLDIRPLRAIHPNIVFRQCDLMNPPEDLKNYCDSLSCLHTLEHFGLGRYGDPVNFAGYLQGFSNLKQMLRPGGMLYLSVPIGEERIEFNGHRVFAINTIITMTQDDFDLVGFSYVDDSGALHESVELGIAERKASFDLEYGCGIFELRKKGGQL
jgi:hypothetical protein